MLVCCSVVCEGRLLPFVDEPFSCCMLVAFFISEDDAVDDDDAAAATIDGMLNVETEYCGGRLCTRVY